MEGYQRRYAVLTAIGRIGRAASRSEGANMQQIAARRTGQLTYAPTGGVGTTTKGDVEQTIAIPFSIWSDS